MYCTVTHILTEIDRAILLQLVNDESVDPATINLDDPQAPARQRIDEQIQNATAEIDGYLKSRYTVPLTPVPRLIQVICTDLTLYNLYKRRHREEMPESILSIYKDRVKLLEQLQKGFVTLGSSTQPQDNRFIRTNKTEHDREFSSDWLRRM